jgi:hypothetical protein
MWPGIEGLRGDTRFTSDASHATRPRHIAQGLRQESHITWGSFGARLEVGGTILGSAEEPAVGQELLADLGLEADLLMSAHAASLNPRTGRRRH